MKRILIFLSCCCVLQTPLAFSSSILIYGIEKAKTYVPKNESKLYIQLGSFVSVARANAKAAITKQKTEAKVVIKKSGNFNKVIVGPLSKQNFTKVVQEISGQIISTPKTNLKKEAKHKTPPKVFDKFNNSAKNNHHNLFISAGGGVIFSENFATNRINNGSSLAAPYNQDTYTVNNGQNGSFIIALGNTWRNMRPFSAITVGGSWQHIFISGTDGTISQYSSPIFLNYDYAIDRSSEILAAFVKFNLTETHNFSPFAFFALGGAFNRTENYYEMPREGVTPRESPAFADKTTSNLAYKAGLGLDYIMSEKLILSLGFNYLDLGKLWSGKGYGTWGNDRLNFVRWQGTELMLQANYYFDSK